MKKTPLESRLPTSTFVPGSSFYRCKCVETCIGLNAVAYLDDHGKPKISHCIGPLYCIACGGLYRHSRLVWSVFPLYQLKLMPQIAHAATRESVSIF